MRAVAGLFTLALATSMTSCAGEPSPAAHPAALVNGAASTDAAVIAVIHTRPAGTRQLCTGTLVAPTVVVTAKHCVFEDMGGADWVANPVSSMSISLGDSVSSPTGEIAVTAITTTAGPYHDGDGALGGDIAVLVLASAPPGVSPVGVASAPPSVGAALRIAGFGYTGGGATGTLGDRNEGSASIVSVAAGTFTSEGASWTCTGDSGGPAFVAVDGTLVGVTSVGPSGCPASTSIYTRIDRHFDLLAAAGVPVSADDAGTDVDGGGTATTDASDTPIDAGPTPPSSAGCSCRALRSGHPSQGLALTALAWAASLRWRRRACAAGTPARHRPCRLR